MKRFYILIAIICSFITAKAQFGIGGGSSIVGKISGTVIDSVTKKPMDYASVGLYRSGGKSPITGVITDEKGNFRLDNVHPGTYKLSITFIGYPTKIIEPVVTTDSKPDKNLGVVVVSPGAKTLKEVVVTGQAALIENRIDKIVYNAEKDITAAGGTATDLLQKVPLVTVDINGNVSIRGDQNIRVLINGKPSGATSASLSDVLKSIPADQIKSIEVVTSPSAKYDAEGSAGILNIITKQKNVSGFSGSVTGGVGTRQNNGNTNLNYNKNRFNISANIGGNASWPQTSLTDFQQKIDIDHDTVHIHTLNNTNGTSRLTRHALVGSLTAGYEFNSFNSITSTFRFNQIQFNTNGNSSTISDIPYTSTSLTHNRIDGFDWNLDYTHKFKKEGHELDFSTQWSHNAGTTDFSNIYSAVHNSLQDNIIGTNNEYTLQVDYTLPINKVFKLEAGGKSIFRRISSTSDNFLYDNNSMNFIFDPVNSDVYDYNQNVYAGYSVLTITLPKSYTVLAGIRDESTDINGNSVNPTQTLPQVNQNYNTFVPSLTLQKQFSATQTIKLAYSKRITRPSLQYLNPFVNKSNPNALSVGNPDLNPEISQTLEFDYNSFIGTSILNLSAYYKHTSGLIEGIAAADPNIIQGGTLTTYQNIGSNNSIGASFFGTINPFKALTIIGNINAYTYKPDPSGAFHLAQSQNGTYIQYAGFLRASLTLPANLVAESFAFGSASRRTIQGETPSFSIFGFGVKKQFMQKKMAIGLNAIDPFSKYKNFDSHITSPGLIQTSSFQLPFRSFGLTFSYSFGKLSFASRKEKDGLNDDLKQGDQGMGGAPVGGAGTTGGGAAGGGATRGGGK